MSINAHRTVITEDGRGWTLNDLMSFDHVIHVDEHGNITEPDGIYAPEAYEFLPDGEQWTSAHDGDYKWSLMNGYSRQQYYRGPWMHASEFIGGGMADDILNTPGLYVAIADHENDSWAVAYILDDTED